MSTEKTQLKMRYRNAAYSTVTQTLDDPKTDLTGDQVRTSMNNIISADVFTSAGGELIAPASAVMIITSETPLF